MNRLLLESGSITIIVRWSGRGEGELLLGAALDASTPRARCAC